MLSFIISYDLAWQAYNIDEHLKASFKNAINMAVTGSTEDHVEALAQERVWAKNNTALGVLVNHKAAHEPNREAVEQEKAVIRMAIAAIARLETLWTVWSINNLMSDCKSK